MDRRGNDGFVFVFLLFEVYMRLEVPEGTC